MFMWFELTVDPKALIKIKKNELKRISLELALFTVALGPILFYYIFKFSSLARYRFFSFLFFSPC